MARAARSGIGHEAVIGRGTRVRGRISGEGDLLVEGTVEGDIVLSGDLAIAEGASATSSVEAQAVTVNGALDGDVRARGAVVIGTSARVHGDIVAESVSLEEGAELVGRVESEFDLPPELSGGGAGGRRR